MNAVASAVTTVLRSNKPPRQVTAAGLSLVQHAEGEPGTGRAVLTAYQDDKGVWTIGWGHTDGVYAGQTCTETQALQWLDDDLDEAENAVCQLVTVPLSDAQFDALASLVFNIGRGAFFASTLRRKLNAADYAGATAEFSNWNKITVAGKLQVSRGLTNRRAQEAALFASATLPTAALPTIPVTVPAPSPVATDDAGLIVPRPVPTLPSVPPIVMPPNMANEVPTAPPTGIGQVPGGKTGIAALATGAAGILTEGWQQVAPVVAALHRIVDGTASGSGILRVTGAVLAVVSVGFLAFAAWKQHRAVTGKAL